MEVFRFAFRHDVEQRDPVTTILLIRHGHHDLVEGTLAGRAAGNHLSNTGRAQATWLASLDVNAVHASPVERAQETARPLADRLGLPVRLDRAFDEIDFGEWTMRTFAELDPDAAWQEWNGSRATARASTGETMVGVQGRVAAGLIALAAAYPGEVVAVVSHGDVIKAALLPFLRLGLGDYATFEVEPGSVSVIELEGTAGVVKGVGWPAGGSARAGEETSPMSGMAMALGAAFQNPLPLPRTSQAVIDPLVAFHHPQ